MGNRRRFFYARWYGYEFIALVFGMLITRLDMFGNVMDYKIYNDSLEDDFALEFITLNS